MGSSYSNLTLRGADRERTIAALSEWGREAIVGPERDGAFVVFDEAAEQDPTTLSELAAQLTAELGGVALAATVYDDDVLYLALSRKGRVPDEYDSNPGYWDGSDAPPCGGNARLLSAAFGVPAARQRVEAILRDADGEYRDEFATEHHAALARALGLPPECVGLGYKYVRRGDEPDLLRQSTRVTRPAPGAGGAADAARDRRRAAVEAHAARVAHPANQYLHAFAACDAPAMRALFRGEPDLDDPVSGRVRDDDALGAHVERIRTLFAGRKVEFRPGLLLESPARTIANGQLVVVNGRSTVAVGVACVWDPDPVSGIAPVRVYYPQKELTGRDAVRPPLPAMPETVPVPPVVARHLSALATGDVDLLEDTCGEVPIWNPLGRLEALRLLYGARLGVDGAVVLSPRVVTPGPFAVGLECVATTWDGVDVAPTTVFVYVGLRNDKVEGVTVLSDVGPNREARVAALRRLSSSPSPGSGT